jgi:hypothetical protein
VTYLIGAGIAGLVMMGLTSSEPGASKRGTSEPKKGAAEVCGVKADQSNCESSSSRATFLGPRPASERRKIATSKIGLASISRGFCSGPRVEHPPCHPIPPRIRQHSLHPDIDLQQTSFLSQTRDPSGLASVGRLHNGEPGKVDEAEIDDKGREAVDETENADHEGG